MDTSREILFFFSALGAFNGFILGMYFFFFAKPKHISNFFLGLLLTALSIRIGKSVFFYFNDDLAREFLQIGITACAFIGPSLYFYLKSMIHPATELKNIWKYHYAIIAAIMLIVGYCYPWKTNEPIWSCYIIEFVYYEWVAYLLASGFIIWKIFQQFITQKDKFNSVEIWILSIYFGNVIIWLAYKTVAYTSYIVGALSFSFILYLLGLLIFFNKKKESIFFKQLPKYGDKKIKTQEANILLKNLQQIMTEEKIYKNPKLKLSDVAAKLDILPHRLSQFINDNLGKSFPAFINEYRVLEAQEMIKSNDQFTLEAIGNECGFKSRSTFYSSFRKMTGTTPAKYKSKLID